MTVSSLSLSEILERGQVILRQFVNGSIGVPNRLDERLLLCGLR